MGLSGDRDWHPEIQKIAYSVINEPNDMPKNIHGGFTAQIDCGAASCVVDIGLAKSIGLLDAEDTISTNYGGVGIDKALISLTPQVPLVV